MSFLSFEYCWLQPLKYNKKLFVYFLLETRNVKIQNVDWQPGQYGQLYTHTNTLTHTHTRAHPHAHRNHSTHKENFWLYRSNEHTRHRKYHFIKFTPEETDIQFPFNQSEEIRSADCCTAGFMWHESCGASLQSLKHMFWRDLIFLQTFLCEVNWRTAGLTTVFHTSPLSLSRSVHVLSCFYRELGVSEGPD